MISKCSARACARDSAVRTSSQRVRLSRVSAPLIASAKNLLRDNRESATWKSPPSRSPVSSFSLPREDAMMERRAFSSSSPARSITSKIAAASIASRYSMTARTSARSIGVTCQPRPARCVSPSFSSLISAARMGVRDASSIDSRPRSLSFSPGTRSSDKIAARRAA